MNHLYYGDNLDILRADIRDESVDLIYLDPPTARREGICHEQHKTVSH